MDLVQVLAMVMGMAPEEEASPEVVVVEVAAAEVEVAAVEEVVVEFLQILQTNSQKT